MVQKNQVIQLGLFPRGDVWPTRASHVKPERATEAKLIMLCYDKERRCIGARRMVNLVT